MSRRPRPPTTSDTRFPATAVERHSSPKHRRCELWRTPPWRYRPPESLRKWCEHRTPRTPVARLTVAVPQAVGTPRSRLQSGRSPTPLRPTARRYGAAGIRGFAHCRRRPPTAPGRAVRQRAPRLRPPTPRPWSPGRREPRHRRHRRRSARPWPTRSQQRRVPSRAMHPVRRELPDRAVRRGRKIVSSPRPHRTPRQLRRPRNPSRIRDFTVARFADRRSDT